MNVLGPSDRRGRELGLAARPLLVLSRGPHSGSHNAKNQNKKPLTRISLQNPPPESRQSCHPVRFLTSLTFSLCGPLRANSLNSRITSFVFLCACGEPSLPFFDVFHYSAVLLPTLRLYGEFCFRFRVFRVFRGLPLPGFSLPLAEALSAAGIERSQA